MLTNTFIQSYTRTHMYRIRIRAWRHTHKNTHKYNVRTNVHSHSMHGMYRVWEHSAVAIARLFSSAATRSPDSSWNASSLFCAPWSSFECTASRSISLRNAAVCIALDLPLAIALSIDCDRTRRITTITDNMRSPARVFEKPTSPFFAMRT